MDKDLISRKAVQDMIDRIAEMHPYRQIGKPETYSEYNEAWEDAVNRIGAELNDLSSAQPEHLVKGCGNLVKGLVNDCISREDAIDAVKHHMNNVSGGNDEYYIAHRHIIELLQIVPTAEPESRREWYMHGCRDAQAVSCTDLCVDCPLFDREKHNCPRFNRVIPRAIEEVKPRWIPATERLPENIRPVIVTWKNNDPESYYQYIVGKHFIGVAHFKGGKWYWYSSTTEDFLAEYGRYDGEEFDEAIEVIAWCELPEPYEGGQDEL